MNSHNPGPRGKRPRPPQYLGSGRANKNSWQSRRGRPRRQHQREESGSATQAASCSSVLLCSVCQQVENPKYKCPHCRATYCSVACCRKHKQEASASTSTSCAGKKQQQTEKEQSSNTTRRSQYLREEFLPTENSNETAISARSAACARLGIVQDDDDNNDVASVRNRESIWSENMEDGWKLSSEMVQAMHASEWLQPELADDGLRHLIHHVVAASNRLPKGKRGRHQPPLQGGGGSHPELQQTPQERLLEQFKVDHPRFKLFLDKLLVLTGTLERTIEEGEQRSSPLGHWLQHEGDAQGQEYPLTLKPLPSFRREVASCSPLPEDAVTRDDDVNAALGTRDDDGSSSSAESSTTSSSESDGSTTTSGTDEDESEHEV